MIHGNRPTDCQEYANPLELMNRLSFDSDLCVNVLTFKLVYSNMVTYEINQTTGQNVFASNVKKCCVLRKNSLYFSYFYIILQVYKEARTKN